MGRTKCHLVNELIRGKYLWDRESCIFSNGGRKMYDNLTMNSAVNLNRQRNFSTAANLIKYVQLEQFIDTAVSRKRS